MTKDDLLSFLKKNPIGVGCGLLSIGLGAAIYFRGDKLPAAEEELIQQSAEASRLAANLQNAAQLKEQLEALVTADKEVESRLLHASQTLNNYQIFYKLESETGAKMTINPGVVAAPKPGQKNAFVSVPFSITAQGTQAQILDLLRRLESGAHYCRIMSASCSVPVVDRNGALSLSLNLELLGLP